MPVVLARHHRVWTLVLVVALLLPAAGTAFGQIYTSGAISTYLDPSVPSAGMGGATVAAFWTDLNEWSNPALLGYQRGFRYSYGRAQLIPDLADDVILTSHRFAIGAYGVGISIAGKPIDGFGGTKLDYGENVVTDDEGNVIGTYHPYEKIRQFGLGVNLLEMLESLVGATGSDVSSLSRHLDISLGHSWKDVLVDLGPTGRGDTTEKDWGALARLTPIGARASAPVTVALSAALSRRNYDDSRIVYVGQSESDPVVEQRLVGGAAHIGFNLPVGPGGVWDVLTPSIGIGATWQEARYYEGGIRLGDGVERRTGQEINFLGIVSGRHGYVDDDAGGIHNDTWGVSAGLQYRGIFGVRYDWAQVPQSEFLDQEVERRGVTAFFDPFRLWRETHGTTYDPFAMR
jgi:hypothetical protein